MDILSWILHLDQHLADAISAMGGWFYVVLFAIVFCETGLIITRSSLVTHFSSQSGRLRQPIPIN